MSGTLLRLDVCVLVRSPLAYAFDVTGEWNGSSVNPRINYVEEGSYHYDPEQFAGNQIPILVIGTKADSAETLREKGCLRASSIAEECGADEFNMDSLQVNYLAPGSTNAVKLSKFFDKVIERKVYMSQGHISPVQSRRMWKNAHID